MAGRRPRPAGSRSSHALLAFMAVLLLGSCADDEPSSSSRSSSSGSGRVVSVDGAHYKVGRPYEIDGVTYYPREDFTYDETGVASWYGPGFDGKLTANGEIYDQDAMTAAHPTLQMPAWVRVTNLENGRQVTLRVNDRGPFRHRRLIDLSRGAAEELGFLRAGTARVRVQVMEEESRQLAEAARRGDPAAFGRGGEAPSRTIVAAAPRAFVAPEPALAVSAPITAVVVPPPPARPTIATAPVVIAALPATPADDIGELLAELPPLPTRPPQLPQPLQAALPAPQPAPSALPFASQPAGVYVQAGDFGEFAIASALQERLDGITDSTITSTTVDGARIFQVRIGPLGSEAEARSLAAQIDGARVVVE